MRNLLPPPLGAVQAASLSPAELESAIRTASLAKGLSSRTTATYLDWYFRFLLFHGRRHAATMGAPEVGAFLSYLSSERKVAASSLHQARFALTFVYEKVLGISLERLRFRQLYTPARAPHVCSPATIKSVLMHVTPEWQCAATLLYACGLRLHECLALRVMDIDLDFKRLAVRLPDGKLDRFVPLPPSILPVLEAQLDHARAAFQHACLQPSYIGAPARGHADVVRDSRFAYLFPAQHLVAQPGNTLQQRHLSESGLQKAIKAAFRTVDPALQCSCNTLRHSFAAHQLAAGQSLETVQAWLGQKGLRYVRGYLGMAG